MAMAYKQKLRRSKQRKAPPPKEIPPLCPPTPQRASFVEQKKSVDLVDRTDRPAIRFVRVEDRLIKVPEGLFAQMSGRIRDSLGFTSATGGGSTPERPIFLRGHTSDQFEQLLRAYNSYPSLDMRTMTLDNILTIGELAVGYEMRILVEWLRPCLHILVLDHNTPLRTAGSRVYQRMLWLAMCLRSWKIYTSIVDKWISRLYWGQLPPIPALLFADAHGIAHLLSHACYVYLVDVQKLLTTGKNINENGALSPRQEMYIKSGYLSLKTTWSKLQRNALEFRSSGCVLHAQCVSVWRQRWKAFANAPCSTSDVDVLKRLSFMEDSLREDVVLDRCMAPSCKALALGAIKRRRNEMALELHHHFDL
ncbi:unnamed protein product [Cyclocybe aegerita]|uniref:Uncharacterized protein n=1 Tax=Cyclocybe aegerita TaxID=1973307 RepID=A0A8S0XQB9_CYCAE|nr:unnamed protein product [Cyclocybe aegerita]